MNDLAIVKEIKNNDFSNFSELVGRHSGICFQVGKKYIPMASGQLSFNDLEYLKDEIILGAARTYKEDSSKFVTWVGNYARYFCLNSLKDTLQPNTFPVGDDVSLFESEQIEDKSPEFDNLETIKDLLNKSEDETTKKIINLRFFSGGRKPMSYKEIGEKVNLSYEMVRIYVNRFIESCREKVLVS